MIMQRKINKKLIGRLIQGNLMQMLNHIKAEERQLRLEVRGGGRAFIYYKKCKILDLGLNSLKIDGKYYEDKKMPDNIEYKIINKPAQYFTETISAVDKWLKKHPKQEFESQQNIAFINQEEGDRYIILDMEYNFSQSEIIKADRVKKAGFDLVGIERKTGKIIFFEVKKGFKALTGKAGISTHIRDFEECLFGRNKEVFTKNLIRDIKNIVSDKKQLGIIKNFALPVSLSAEGIELIFVFEPVSADKGNYSAKYDSEYLKSGSIRSYATIYTSEGDYKLQ